jgi:uncharacterized protein
MYAADLSLAVAAAEGLYFVDRFVKKNEKYLYKIQIILDNDTITGSAFVGGEQEIFLETPSNLQLECKNSIANLRWDRALLSNYVAYIVERATNSADFERVTEAPVVTLAPTENLSNRYEYFVDSLKADVEYSYRVLGQSVFGDYSLPSAIKTCKNADDPGFAVFILRGYSLENKSVQVEWECTDNPAIRGFMVERAINDAGPYTLLNSLSPLSPTDRSFLDVKPTDVNYYRVIALYGNDKTFRSSSFFVPLVDSIPPLTPFELIGNVDDFGVARVSWKSNSEADLFGFRVYVANNRSEEMSQLTNHPVQASAFQFKVNPRTLNDSIYFAVISVDNNQNESALSKIVSLALPDHINPTAPVMLPLEIDSIGIVVRWMPSSSRDVKSYDVYRQVAGDSRWIRINMQNASTTDAYRFIDRNAIKNAPALYTVVAVDDSGLESERPTPVETKNITITLAPAVRWKNSIALERQKVLLRWDYNQRGVKAFKLYKSMAGGLPSLYKTFPGKQLEFTDTLVPGTKCVFQIRALFEDGTASSLSEKLLIEQ